MLLAIAPWTLLWDRNYFIDWWPSLADMLANQFVRGAVSGVGIVTLLAGVRDLAGAILARHAARSAPASSGPTWPDPPRP